MKTNDLMRPVPVLRSTEGLQKLKEVFGDPAVRGVAVVDASGSLAGFLTDQDIIDALIPGYVREDESLAGVIADSESSELLEKLQGKNVGEILRASEVEHPTLSPGDSFLEALTALAGTTASAVLVVADGKPVGTITVDHALRKILGAAE